MFPAYGCLVALQQAMCHGERYVQSGGEKGDNGNICSLAAFEDMKVSTPKGDQGGIKHRGLPAGSQSVVHSLGELGLTREMGDLFCEKNILIT